MIYRTLKCIAKNKINSYRSTQLLLSLPITGWKLQYKNSDRANVVNQLSRGSMYIKKGRVINTIFRNRLFVRLLDMGGQRAFIASPSSLLSWGKYGR